MLPWNRQIRDNIILGYTVDMAKDSEETLPNFSGCKGGGGGESIVFSFLQDSVNVALY